MSRNCLREALRQLLPCDSWHEIGKKQTVWLSRSCDYDGRSFRTFSGAFWRVGKCSAGWGQRTCGLREPRWTLQPAPISSQRWYNWQGRTEQGRHLWSSTGSSFPHCAYSLSLYVHRLHSPPSLSHYPPVTAGQFVHPAWLPPPLLLRYLAPLLLFNGRYWLENFHDPFAIPCLRPLPFPATFNLITGFPKLFRGGQSQENNSRTSGFANTLLVVVWLWRGVASPRPARTITTNYHSVRPSAALGPAGEFFKVRKTLLHVESWYFLIFPPDIHIIYLHVLIFGDFGE